MKDQNLKDIVLFFYQGADIKLSGHVRPLGEACQLPVDIGIEAAVHALKAQNRASAGKGLRQIKPAQIAAYRRLIRHMGRIIGNRIVDIGVLGLSKTLHLPAARHPDALIAQP